MLQRKTHFTDPARIKPLRDLVLLRRSIEKEDPFAGELGLILMPEEKRRRSQEAEVVAVGPGLIKKGRRQPVALKPGDRILVGRYTAQGTKFNVDGVEYQIQHEEDILCTLEEGK